ncbi:hypothetical protein NE865_13206 [Phthorimaea operculella]|nr:hypothetical protein NE865_13206 [Phthorimaea operculella]
MPPTESEVQHAVAVPKPNPRNNPTMFKIFQNVQYNVVQHKKYVKEMKKLYKKLDEGTFRESFKNAMEYLFTFGDTSANVDRVVQFVATFCTSLDDEEEFLMFIFEIIFECQCVSGQSVRYRASQLLAAVLAALGEDACLDDELCDKLLESQMQRFQDTRGAVRCRAALALQRLQSPPDDEVTRAYRFHMSCDPSSSVRRAVLMSIAKCKPNVPFVLERLCDVDEAVRRAAFLYMAAMPVTQLKVTQRILTLKVGLTERSPRVRRVVEEILIPGWLSTFKGNIIDLLKAIRLDNINDAKDSHYVAGKLLESLFKRLPISELLEWLPTDKTLRLIPAEKLNKESAWYWSHLAEHLQKIDDDETLETVLPDLVVLTGYIRAIVESPCPNKAEDLAAFTTRQYVLHELARMLRVYDASDPAGRTALQSLITDVLTGDYGPLDPEVIRAFVSALEMVVTEVNQRMEVIAGVINSLRDPPEPDMPPPPPVPVEDAKTKLERARLRVSLNVAIEAQEEAVREQNYALAAECKAKVEDIQKKLETIKEKISDTETLNKCLVILNSALDTPQLTTVTPVLRMIFTELEVEIFQNPDILENALETVALYGMLDKDFAKENKAFFFANLIDTTNESVVCTVLKCCVDLLCVHGARVFEDSDSQDDTEKSKRTTLGTTRQSVDADGQINTINESLVCTVLKCCVDLLCVHGARVFEDGDSQDDTEKSKRTTLGTTRQSVDADGTISDSVMSLSPDHNAVIEILLKIMDGTCAAFRLIIVEGLCRLLHLGHLESPSILSRLLLLWFNPATVEEDMLRQTIGVFFQTFPTSVDGAQEQIQKATLPTLRALANAPSSSPLAEIDQEAVVRFIVSLTRVNHELMDSQGGMAMVLTHSLSKRPASAEAGLICRMLALLSAPREARLASELAATLRDTCTKLPDKQSQRNLTRYLGALEAAERASLNKMSHTGVTEGTIQQEDTLNPIGRATTSLPQPLARSTHVVINETVEEEVEIDETSPTEPSKISTDTAPAAESTKVDSPTSNRQSAESDSAAANVQSEDSDGISPEKKAKITKAKKKKLSLSKQPTEENDKPTDSKETQKKTKGKKGEDEVQKDQEQNEKGVKRSRSQRSLVDVERAKKNQAEKSKKAQEPDPSPPKVPEDLDVSNVTVRKSIRGLQSGSSTESTGSSSGSGKGKKAEPKKKKETGKKKQTGKKPQTRSSTGSRSSVDSPHFMTDDSADETELHTIVYDQGIEQSLLNDSSELQDSKQVSKSNVTIPETPDDSEASESDPEPEPVKAKGKKNGKKK